MGRRDDEDLAGDEEDHHTSDRKSRRNYDSGVDKTARDRLRGFVERIERLEEEKKTVSDDIKDVYGEAKGEGYDTKALRSLIKIRKQDKDERMEQEAILNTYLAALGMIEDDDED